MDYQIMFNIAVTLIAAMGGWILGRITKALDQLDQDVRSLPMNYVSKADYRDDIREIKEGVQRIYEKLDGKADKGR